MCVVCVCGGVFGGGSHRICSIRAVLSRKPKPPKPVKSLNLLIPDCTCKLVRCYFAQNAVLQGPDSYSKSPKQYKLYGHMDP